MNRRFALVFLALLLCIPAFAGGLNYQIGVNGLACPFCAYGIEKRLNVIDGVEKISVDIEAGEVIVSMAEGKRLSEAQAQEKVEEAGFTLNSFLVSGVRVMVSGVRVTLIILL